MSPGLTWGAVMKTSTDGGLWTLPGLWPISELLLFIDYYRLRTAGRLLWTHVSIKPLLTICHCFWTTSPSIMLLPSFHCESPAGCAVHQYLYLLAAKNESQERCFRCKLHSWSEPWLSNLWTSTLPVTLRYSAYFAVNVNYNYGILWGCKESDTTEQLNWTELNLLYSKVSSSTHKKKSVPFFMQIQKSP